MEREAGKAWVAMTNSTKVAGRVIAVRGAVVDVAFEAGEFPRLEEALVVKWDQPQTLIVEVEAHLDERTVRGVALQHTAGLRRGTSVRASGSPVTVPVGDALLGRLLDVVGTTRDNGPPLPPDIERLRLVAVEQFLPSLDRVAKNETYMHSARALAAELAEAIRKSQP